ncbi:MULTISPECIES: RNA polymerase sigma factor [Nocardiaceae]|uniref:RNA polymerase sigma factor n=1 Tax=Rhodococcoides corynebacterioides TaxID=53972 RepID=A0ABS2KU17_9NOCA|nr:MULTISPECIES: RNA polymerase sigma factor [Rhodococcus]MBM7415435.1 RNA polymerase sigma-70 factor (ECF subfamily) [Rhodococcus corynebacterioides]MBP1117897.1 RNA polymerase sigma-70 factor (ECF subfamily) [Rhodococcus sp. PvP016]
MLSRPSIAPDPGSPDVAGDVVLPSTATPSADRDTSTRPTFAADYRELGDRALAAAAGMGDRRAFEEIVRRLGPDMLRYATHLLSDRGAAEDIVQDALVDAWRGLRHFRSDSSLRTWLFSVVSHKVTDHRRRRSIAPVEDWVFERPSQDPRDDPSRTVSDADFLSALDDALAELPYRQRACWLLREVEGMKHTEIGTVMALSPGAVRGHLTRARATLETRLETWR